MLFYTFMYFALGSVIFGVVASLHERDHINNDAFDFLIFSLVIWPIIYPAAFLVYSISKLSHFLTDRVFNYFETRNQKCSAINDVKKIPEEKF